MAKYHLTDNGPAPCRVVTGRCPFGEEHFSTKKEATAVYEERMAASESPLTPHAVRPDIAAANNFLDPTKNPPLSPEELDRQLEDLARLREKVKSIYDAAKEESFHLSGGEIKFLNDLKAQTAAQVANLVDRHETEVLELKKVQQIISTLNAEAKTNPDFDYDVMLPLYAKVRDREEYKNLLRDVVDAAKDNHAILVATGAIAEETHLRSMGHFPVFRGKEFYNEEGVLVGKEAAYFPSGSVEWQEERSKGIGGSDIGYIISASNVARKPALPNGEGEWVYLDDVPRYASGNPEELINKKLNPRPPEEDHRYRDGAEKFTDATGRGDAWEKELLLRQMEKYPGEVAYCKASFQAVDHPALAYNFDGLMLNKDTGRPNGVIEIKTASHPEYWGNPADGLDGVPDNYRAQVLHYALEAGFNRGRVAVIINDGDVREYDFNFTDSPELKEEALKNREKAIKLSQQVRELKAAGETHYEKPTRKINAFTKGQMDPKDLASKKRLFETAAVYRGVTPAQIKREYLAKRAEGLDTPEAQKAALRSLFTTVGEKDKPPRRITGVDLETSGLSPGKGRIIDLGVDLLERGERKKYADELYGLSAYGKRHERGVGYEGLREVHGITGAMLQDREPFVPNEELIRTLTKKGTVLMAHNADFEVRWLSSYVPGFNNAVRRGDVRIIDSKHLSQWLDDSEGNTMNHYGHKWGVYSTPDGEEEHRAYADARDMMDAYEAQRSALRGPGN